MQLFIAVHTLGAPVPDNLSLLSNLGCSSSRRPDMDFQILDLASQMELACHFQDLACDLSGVGMLDQWIWHSMSMDLACQIHGSGMQGDESGMPYLACGMPTLKPALPYLLFCLGF